MNNSVTIKLFAGLGQNFSVPDSIVLEQTRSLGEILSLLGIPAEKIAIALRNGRHAEMTDAVHPGDTLSLFPPIGGG